MIDLRKSAPVAGEEEKCFFRYVSKSDIPAIAALEDNCWTDEQYLTVLRGNSMGLLVEDATGQVVGCMVYEFTGPNSADLFVQNFSVMPGTCWATLKSMIDKLQSKLYSPRRTRLYFEISEHRLDMHLFLQACGLRAAKVNRNAGSEGEDSYTFELRLPAIADAGGGMGHGTTNRISKYFSCGEDV